MPNATRSEVLQHELKLASLRSHEMHMRHIYNLRWGGLAFAALAMIVGAAMIFMGLQGSFTWAVEAPASVGAKLTNASPGIVFATVGLLVAFIVVMQKPVGYSTGMDASNDDPRNPSIQPMAIPPIRPMVGHPQDAQNERKRKGPRPAQQHPAKFDGMRISEGRKGDGSTWD